MSTTGQHNLTRNRLKGHLALARISNSPTVVTNVLAGAAFAGVLQGTFPGQTLLWLSIALLAFYTAGMYLNDLCDYEIDRHERAERPLVQGLVSINEARTVTLVLFLIGNGVLLMLTPRLIVPGVILTTLIILYDVWHKNNPFSPLIMGANRFMVYIIAFLAFTPTLQLEVLIGAAFLWLYILGVTFIAKSENLPRFSQYWPLAVLLSPALYYAIRYGQIIFPLLFAAWIIYSAKFIYRDKRIQAGIGALLAGICLLDGAALAANQATFTAVTAVAACGLTLLWQRFIKGT